MFLTGAVGGLVLLYLFLHELHTYILHTTLVARSKCEIEHVTHTPQPPPPHCDDWEQEIRKECSRIPLYDSLHPQVHQPVVHPKNAPLVITLIFNI